MKLLPLPFTLSEIIEAKDLQAEFGASSGAWRAIDAPGHGGFALVVWRMEDDERSPKQEATAEFLVKAANMHQRLLDKLYEAAEALAATAYTSGQAAIAEEAHALLNEAK